MQATLDAASRAADKASAAAQVAGDKADKARVRSRGTSDRPRDVAIMCVSVCAAQTDRQTDNR